jgi:hydrogenase maturation protein HypF
MIFIDTAIDNVLGRGIFEACAETIRPEYRTFIGVRLQEGKIVAVKGLGGYHLSCDALRNDVVRELRRRKQREAKPLAVMVQNLDTAWRLCAVSAVEAELLTSARCPIVLLRKRPDCPSPEKSLRQTATSGSCFPYTSLYHLLLQQAARSQVMTSGNLTEEPIAYQDNDAARRLAGIAEYFLTHNWPIQMHCDDSVTRIVLGEEFPL